MHPALAERLPKLFRDVRSYTYGLTLDDKTHLQVTLNMRSREAAEKLHARGVELMLEPLNPRGSPGYFLNDFDQTERIIRDLALPNVKLQFDVYHCQIVHGDVTMRLRAQAPLIGHVQISSVPDRQEPDSGELNDSYVLAELERLGYAGFVGCEYRPRAGTIEGLGWMEKWKK